MSKLPHGAKSQFVREYLSVNPNAVAKEAVAALRVNGIDVSEALVTKLKHRGRSAKRRSKARLSGAVVGAAMPQAAAPPLHIAARKMPAAKKPAGALTVEQLFAVKQFVETLGGANNVRAALDMLDQLR